MSAYLQRLFDRAARSAPQPAPTGASLSPLAESDQRMNDPQFAGLFGLGFARPDEAESDGDASSFRPDARLPPAPRATPVPAPPPTRQEPRAAPEQSPRRVSEPPSAPAIPPFLDVGRIFPDDLQLPDTATQRAQPPAAAPAPSSPPPAEPVMPSTVAAPHDEAVDATARPAPVPAPRDSPAMPEPVHARAQPQPVRDRAVPAAPIEPQPADSAVPPPATEGSDEPARERDAAPVMMMPPRVTPQPIAAPETSASATETPRTAPPPPPRPVREERAAEQRKPDTPVHKRPMTAATASLIGPLVAEPRARTLFGLRRR
jgi:hypothetical protein